MNKKLPNLELILYKAQQALAQQEAWKLTMEEARKLNRFTRPDFIAEVFPQTWGSTNTGFDIGQDGSPTIVGQAMTEEYTTVIHERTANFYCIFFGEDLCYIISGTNKNFSTDLKNHSIASLSVAREKY